MLTVMKRHFAAAIRWRQTLGAGRRPQSKPSFIFQLFWAADQYGPAGSSGFPRVQCCVNEPQSLRQTTLLPDISEPALQGWSQKSKINSMQPEMKLCCCPSNWVKISTNGVNLLKLKSLVCCSFAWTDKCNQGDVEKENTHKKKKTQKKPPTNQLLHLK